MARRASSRAISLIALAFAAVVVALMVASLATSSLLGERHPSAAQIIRRTHVTPIRRSQLTAPAIPGWLESLLLVLLVLAIAALIMLAKGRRRPLDERFQYEEDPEAAGGDWEAQITVKLGEAAAEQLRRLQEGDPRNAIVACWMHLQDAAARAGLPATATETSTEFTVRALRRLMLDQTAITTLSALYREARFSDHEMGESARGRAIAAVETLSTQLNVHGAELAFTTTRGIPLDSVTP